MPDPQNQQTPQTPQAPQQQGGQYQYRLLPDGKYGEFPLTDTEDVIQQKIAAYGSKGTQSSQPSPAEKFASDFNVGATGSPDAPSFLSRTWQGVKNFASDPLGSTDRFVQGQVDQYSDALSQAKNYGWSDPRLYESAVPVVGPALVNITNKALQEGPAAGIATGMGNLAGGAILGKAGEIAGDTAATAPQAISDARSSVAQHIVEPVVRRPRMQTMENMRVGIDPARAIVNEGYKGGYADMEGQAGAKVSQMKAAADEMLTQAKDQRPIDVRPIIDQAINNAQAAARQLGAADRVNRLEALRQALHTEYGPTVGSPLEINNLKSNIGDRAFSTGAYKGVEPVEESVAGALSDVYTGIKNRVNQQVPEAAGLNDRMADSLQAQGAMFSNRAGGTGQSLATVSPYKRAAGVALGAPVRSRLARMVAPNAPEPVPQVPINPANRTPMFPSPDVPNRPSWDPSRPAGTVPPTPPQTPAPVGGPGTNPAVFPNDTPMWNPSVQQAPGTAIPNFAGRGTQPDPWSAAGPPPPPTPSIPPTGTGGAPSFNPPGGVQSSGGAVPSSGFSPPLQEPVAPPPNFVPATGRPGEPVQPTNPQEVQDVQKQTPRAVTPTNVRQVLADKDVERNVSSAMKGNRRDTAGEIREAHREKLEKKDKK